MFETFTVRSFESFTSTRGYRKRGCKHFSKECSLSPCKFETNCVLCIVSWVCHGRWWEAISSWLGAARAFSSDYEVLWVGLELEDEREEIQKSYFSPCTLLFSFLIFGSYRTACVKSWKCLIGTYRSSEDDCILLLKKKQSHHTKMWTWENLSCAPHILVSDLWYKRVVEYNCNTRNSTAI